MKKLLLLLILICIPLALAEESSYELSFFKVEGQPLDQPIIYNRLIEFIETTSNETANIKIDNQEYEITDEYQEFKGLRIKVEEAQSRIQLKKKNDDTIYQGQYATITFKQIEPKEWNYVLEESETLNYRDHTITLTTVGLTEDNENAITLKIDDKEFGMIQGDEQVYNGILVTANHITVGRGITAPEKIKAAKISVKSELDLTHYPNILTETTNKLTLVSPRDAPSYYSIVMTELALSLSPKKQTEIKFDDELEDNNQNIVSIGCNTVTEQFTSCDTTPGEGKVKLVKDNNRFILILLGYGENELRGVGEFLRSFQKMQGTEQTIETTPSDIPEEQVLEKAQEEIKQLIEKRQKEETVEKHREPKVVEIKEIRETEPLEQPIIEIKEEKSFFTHLADWIRALFSTLFGFLS